jgi:hypothetical protein
MYQRKYKKGRKIETFEALNHFLDKTKFVYINDKILHEGWVVSLQYRYLLYAMKRGQIFRAIRITKEES